MSGPLKVSPGHREKFLQTLQMSFIRQLLDQASCKSRLILPNLFLAVSRMPPPPWLVRWRNMLRNLMTFVGYVGETLLLYSAVSMKPALKDVVLRIFHVPSTAALSTAAGLAAKSALQMHQYIHQPDNCTHLSGLRTYSAAGMKIQICDVWESMGPHGQGSGSPGNSESESECQDTAQPVRQCQAKDAEPRRPRRRERSHGRGHVPRLLAALLNILAGICSSSSGCQDLSPGRETIKSGGQGYSEVEAHGQVISPAFDPFVETATQAMAREPGFGQHEPGRLRRWSRLDQRSGHGWGAGLRWLRGPGFRADVAGGRARGVGGQSLRPEREVSSGPVLTHAALRTSHWIGRTEVPSRSKLESGSEYLEMPELRQVWTVESEVYANRTARARRLRHHHVDLIEVYGGKAEISHQAIKAGLRVLQPIDRIYGIHLDKKDDFRKVRDHVLRWKPYLTIYEIACTLWSQVQNLNYTAEQLKILRATQDESIQEMVNTIVENYYQNGGHFLLENPAYTHFWKHPAVQRLLQLPGVELRVGHMCRHGLTDSKGQLLKKPTGWMSDLPEILDRLAVVCQGGHQHGQCLGGSETRRAQAYTPQLAKAVIRGIQSSLRNNGDERFTSSCPSHHPSWIMDVKHYQYDDDCELEWQPPGDAPVQEIYFLDVNRHQESWLPLLKEAEDRLRDKVRPSQTVPAKTPFHEQVQSLVPWKLIRVQITRTPMQRRLPLEVIQEGCKHRGAALWMSDGSVQLEAEAVAAILAQCSGRFSTPVRAAVFFYGIAPDTSLNPEDNKKPEPEIAPKMMLQPETDEAEKLLPHQPGYRDISFPGASDVPKWMMQVMRRIHTNLGHPPAATLIRHLSAAGASNLAIKAAKHLQCEVCRQVAPPREPKPAKSFQPRRFNDRLGVDVLWLKDIRGRLYGYLSQVDEATCYHVLNHLHDRTEEEVLNTMVNGWFSYFGPPDELLLDADGCFRGYRFETLQAQCAVKVRFIPADAHYQLGRVERHGQAIKYIVQRLVSQFAPTSVQEMNLLTVMAVSAKNNLLRRSGSSPAQWVYGRNHKLPGALLSSGGNIESCQLASDSDRLREVELVRAEAMAQFHRFEYDNALRAALLRKPRPFRGPFHEGQRVAYFRQKNAMDGEGSLEGYRQGIIVAVDGNTLWIRNNRGRLVSASREQVRDVAGEEEWWAPSQTDLDLLKNSDQDLAEKHSLAYRINPAAVPDAADDGRAVAGAEAPFAELPELPPLDAAGDPLPQGAVAAPVPMLTPTMMVPATPRRSSSAPRTPTARTRSKTPPRLQSLPSVREARPLGPSVSSRTERAELQPLPSQGASRSQSASSRTETPELRPLPSQGAFSRQTTPAGKSSLGSGSGLTAALEQIIEEQYPDRGVKRPAATQEVIEQPPRAPLQPQSSELTPESVLMVFCEDCGEQHRVLHDGVSTCSRCSSTRTVTSPMHVRSWFDEVTEREAIDKMFTPGPPEMQITVQDTKDVDQDREFEQLQATTSTSLPSATSTSSPSRQVPRSVHRLQTLQRHGRNMFNKVGWDGSPTEVQDLFVNHSYLTAAHYFGDHGASDETNAECPTCLTTTTSVLDFKLSVVEDQSARMLHARDFTHATCRQLLDAATSRQGKLRLLFGVDPMLGDITDDTNRHPRLSRYLLNYLRAHGLEGDVSYVQVSKGQAERPKTPSQGMSWCMLVGEKQAGRLWVESKSTQRLHGCVVKDIDNVKVPGFMCDAFGHMVSFRSDCRRLTPPLTEDQWLFDVGEGAKCANLGAAKKMRKYDFIQRSKAKVYFVNEEDVPDKLPWLQESMAEAYPLRAWQTPGEGEAQMLDTSGDEGDDGGHEPSRARKQALKKELPWRAMSKEEVPKFVQAVVDEWSEWTRWSSCKPIYFDVSKIDQRLILKSRVCYRWKPRGDGTWKPKARIVVAGFRDPHLPLLTRDSPVLTRGGLACILQWAASNKVDLASGDCKSAFLQGTPDDERPEGIYMRAPADPVAKQAVAEWSHKDLLYKLTAPVYGQSNAPRRWFLYVLKTLTGLRWEQHSLDPCLFLMKEKVGLDGDGKDKMKVTAVLGIHVDDLIMSALNGHEHHLSEVRGSFAWGNEWEYREFNFVGRRIKQLPDGSITVDQSDYVAEVPLTKVSLPDHEKLDEHPDLVTEFRSGIGSLQWLAGTTRGDIAADVSLLQRPPKELTVADLKEVNSVLRYVRATNGAVVKFTPIPWNDLLFVAYGDSGWANAPNGKSQGGLVVVATHKAALEVKCDASLMEWKSYRHQRVLRSTLAAEAASLDRAEDHAHYLAAMLSEMVFANHIATMNERPAFEVLPVTDARSLWDSVHRMSTSFQEKRVEIDIAALRHQCRNLRWVPTEVQHADALTKRSRPLRDSFRKWMGSPVVTLVESKSPDDVWTSAEANRAWR